MMQFSEEASLAVPCSSNAVQSPTQPVPIRKRRFSSAKIQPTRVKKVMQSDEEIGRMVASVPVAIGRAMEHFAEKLLEAAALCVQCSTSRTLSPAHMKQAMLKYRHFAFLEPLMRDIALPSRGVGEPSWNAETIPQPPIPIMISAPLIDHYYAGAVVNATPQMPMPSYVPQTVPLVQVPSVPSGLMPIGTKRRQSNGTAETPAEGKPKRGRPRKVKKEDKCVDDEGIFMDSTASEDSGEAKSSNGMQMLTDSQLMPPPCLPSLRLLPRSKTVLSPAASQLVPIQSVTVPQPLPPSLPNNLSTSVDTPSTDSSQHS
uniref:Dr1-associated corepressor n=1 Tax=Ascaris suum TaxID=6253 RepID=F1L9Z2_ASCSU